MKVLFFNPQQEMAALQCLSAYLKRAGHSTALYNDPRLFDNYVLRLERPRWLPDPYADGLAAVRDEAPDLIGFTVVSDDYEWALRWAARIKERFDVPIVFGNAHPTFHPEEVLSRPEVDFIARGEGEETLLELVESLGRAKDFSKILGLGYKDRGVPRVNPMRPMLDMDTLPLPDKDLFYERMPYLRHGYHTMAGRGCPYRCTFCDNNSSARLYADAGAARKWTRRRSPRHMIDELVWAKARYAPAHVRFNDEDFNYDRRWLEEFCGLYKKEVGVPYFAWVHPNGVDRSVARLLADSGCEMVEMGIQSGSARMRVEILNRRTTNEQIVGAMTAFREAGVKADVDLIVGLPTETKADLDETVEVLRRGRPHGTYAFWLRYFPSTEIYALAKSRGLLTPEQIEVVEKTGGSQDGGGYFREGVFKRDPVARRYHSFIMFLPVLPDSLIRLCQRRGWIRFTPTFVDTFAISYLRRFFKGGLFDTFHLRIYHMVWWEGRRLAGKVLRRALGRAA